MKTKLFIIAVLAAGLALPAYAAPTFRWEPTPGDYIDLEAVGELRILNNQPDATSGGPFEVDVISGSSPYVYDGLLTWCIENGVAFTSGVHYYYTVDEVAYSGNVAGTVGDPISELTEYIYDQWRAGNPEGWTNEEVNEAIWAAEDEGGDTSSDAYQDALAAGKLASVDASHTYALNLWSLHYNEQEQRYYATDVQSQLVPVPAPSAVLLGSLGVGFVGWLRRRNSV